jgi:type IV pilus assembly protein PilA
MDRTLSDNPALNLRNLTAAQKGFSLIELLIAMAIILILAATAVPNYMAARARANEASAASSIRAIVSAQNLYRNTFGVYTELPSLGADYLTDNRLAAGNKSGYIFESAPGAGSAASIEFTVEGTPQLAFGPSASGARRYYGDQSGVVRFNPTGNADSASPPIQ